MASGVSTSSQLRRRTSVSLLSNEQVRTSVVRELVQTERDFVKILKDVAEGYIAECRRRTDMFNEDQIEAIFINLEELLDFQSNFLKDLEAVVDWNAPHKSCVGECFLSHVSSLLPYLQGLLYWVVPLRLPTSFFYTAQHDWTYFSWVPCVHPLSHCDSHEVIFDISEIRVQDVLGILQQSSDGYGNSARTVSAQ